MAQVQCEITIMRVENLDVTLPPGNLFIRYYVHAGGGRRRIQINTREVSCTNKLHWDEKSSLECLMPSTSMMEAMCTSKVVLELRWSSAKQVFGRVAKSKLLGRAEVGWKDVFGSSERRISFTMKKSVMGELKPPTLVLRMGIAVGVSQAMERRRKHEQNECCGWVGSDEDMFLTATAGSMINVW